MQGEKPEPSELLKSSDKPAVMPVFSEKFAVKLVGLPLSRWENLTCLLPVILAVAMQLRFSHSIMAEGGFVVAGLLGYLALRLWLTDRRYPDPGQIEIDEDRLIIPGSLNQGCAEVFLFSDLTRIELSCYQGKHAVIPISLTICRGQCRIKISLLALDINDLLKALTRRQCRIVRENWTMVPFVAAFWLLILLLVAIILFFNR